MKVLIACEESQEVCKAFRARGHEAYSCDIQEPSGGHPEWHILGDALKALEGGHIVTMDGVTHDVGKWDLLIAHPPCTYLSNAATRSFSLRVTPAEKVVARWAERVKAAIFFMQFMLADVPKVAVENPTGIMNTAYRKADQIIHPYYFAESKADTENYHTKRTCLWLKNLPPLERKNNLPAPEPIYVSNGEKAEENQLVRRHTRNAKRPRGPGKSQKQNRARHCKSNGRTMGVKDYESYLVEHPA